MFGGRVRYFACFHEWGILASTLHTLPRPESVPLPRLLDLPHCVAGLPFLLLLPGLRRRLQSCSARISPPRPPSPHPPPWSDHHGRIGPLSDLSIQVWCRSRPWPLAGMAKAPWAGRCQIDGSKGKRPSGRRRGGRPLDRADGEGLVRWTWGRRR